MRKKTAALLISFLSAGVLALGILAIYNTRRVRALEFYARAQAEHAFQEVVSNLAQLSGDLEKSVYISDPSLQSALCTQVYGRAVQTQMAMGMLPYEAQSLEQTAGFVARVGDYACVLSKAVGVRGGYSEEELENLQSLSDTASALSEQLQELRLQVDNGTMSLATASRAAERGAESDIALADSLADLENEFPELPTLIYDGPFSEGIRLDEPVFLQGKDEVSQDEARKVAAEALALSVEELQDEGESGGDIPSWRFSANHSGGVYSVSVSKQGGVLLSLLGQREQGESKYSADEALALATTFLENLGFEDMERSYHIVQDGLLTVNFISAQDGVVCYPDLIKISVALDNGTLMSCDALGYVSAHRERELPTAALGESEAIAALPEQLQSEQCRLAVIPTDGGGEKLCYEILASGGAHRCLIYTNAVSGAQERILLLMEDENGCLTI